MSAAPASLSTSIRSRESVSVISTAPTEVLKNEKNSNGDYKGFVAGVASGITKLTVGHPFDTIKVRLQTTQKSRFTGPIDCVLQTVRHEGIRGFYKGATPPLVGWMFMDSLMLGSIAVYRRLLHERVFTERNFKTLLPPAMRPSNTNIKQYATQLPTLGHAIAGMMAGWTVSLIATPVEHIKARLQVQYAAEKSKRLYSGPIDCASKIFNAHGIRGLYHGLSATIFLRSFFFFWWGSYSALTTFLTTHTSLSVPSINFFAGGLSAQLFWLTCYPVDVVKNRIMTDPLGANTRPGGSGFVDGERRFWRWKDAARDIWLREGVRGFWRGFVPCFLRAFPANGMALVAFEGVLRGLP